MDATDRIIHQIYEAAAAPEGWPDAAVALSDLVKGGTVHMMLAAQDGSAAYVNLFSGDPDFAPIYLNDFSPMDFRVPRVMARPLGAFTDERAYVSPEEAKVSPIHQDLLPRFEVHRIGGANISLPGCIGFFGISTRRAEEDFDPGQTALLAALSRHVLRAFAITRSRHEISLGRDLAMGALERLNTALFLMRGARVIDANAEARRLLGQGFFLLHNDQLAVANRGERARLERFIACAVRGETGGPMLLRDPDTAGRYVLRAERHEPQFPGGHQAPARHLIVTVSELNRAQSPDEAEVIAFCGLFGVSRAESLAVAAVLGDVSLSDHAAARGIRPGTAQQQLKSAMAKMEIHSQKTLHQMFERYRVFGA
ncbi:helix-turn-helix transcriptional regulator [Pararhizobium haloflavum]|uniref:helix-turn-helix transcriptional regulator n=1 Tax=Pararhizobium haloflavum TaxID=2037914 RepID=UPI000C198FE2|nr:hypothetical protein [Pararhizobium haloflavum]